MDISILRMKLILYEIVLRHTAFNTRKQIRAWLNKCRQSFWCELLAALEAVEFVFIHRIGRFFLYLVRGPPYHKVIT